MWPSESFNLTRDLPLTIFLGPWLRPQKASKADDSGNCTGASEPCCHDKYQRSYGKVPRALCSTKKAQGSKDWLENEVWRRLRNPQVSTLLIISELSLKNYIPDTRTKIWYMVFLCSISSILLTSRYFWASWVFMLLCLFLCLIVICVPESNTLQGISHRDWADLCFTQP